MNGRLIARRRLELSLSRNDLARQTGLGWDLIVKLEGGQQPQALTLNAAQRLAAALAIDLNALVQHSIPHTGDHRLILRLEALLAHTRRPHTPHELARAMDQPIHAITAALNQIEDRLLNTGQTLRRHDGQVELVARGDQLDPDDVAQLRRARDPLGAPEIAMLRRIALGRLRDRCWETLDQADRHLIARLAEHGLIEPGTDHLQLTACAHHCLEPEMRLGPLGVQWPLEHRRAQHART